MSVDIQLQQNSGVQHQGSYLWVLECHVNGKTRTKARQSLEIGGVGKRPTTLSEHRESQRLEVLTVDVAPCAVHRLEQILAGNNLTQKEEKRHFRTACSAGCLWIC